MHVRLFRAHYSPIVDLKTDPNVIPKVLMTSSLDCEVYIWDFLEKKTERKRENNNTLFSCQKVGSLVIKGVNQKCWNIKPDRKQKTKRQLEIKNQIIDKALVICQEVHKEYSD